MSYGWHEIRMFKSHNKIIMVKSIKIIGTFACLLIASMVSLSACSKEKNKIVGAWEVANDDGELSDVGNIWTFRPDMTFLINDGEAGSMTGTYTINDNTLLLKGDGNVYDAIVMRFDGNFSIVKVNNRLMILSGTIKYKEYFDYSYYYYTLSGTTTFSKVK